LFGRRTMTLAAFVDLWQAGANHKMFQRETPR
jgi:hypothetical protein